MIEMTKTNTALAIMFALLMSMQTAFAAAVPPNVKDVKAALISGSLTVTWGAVTDPAGIDYYRVYYSRESILNNRGNFDDFERTTGADTSYTFSHAPYPGKTLFVSVMAVNKAGAESEAFESEASIASPASSTSSSVSSSTQMIVQSSASSLSSSTTASIEPLAITNVVAVSQTGVALSFSKPLDSLKGALNVTSYLIVDASGTLLSIKRATLSGETVVVLATDPQQPGRAYSYALMQPVGALDGSVTPTPPPEGTFVGYQGNGMATSNQPTISVDRTPPEDPLGLSLTPKHRNDSNYDVHAAWTASIDSASDLSSYVVYTTRDGITFSQGSALSATTLQAVYTGVPPGRFGMKVATRDTAGNESHGIVRMINLPASGLPLLGIAALAGAGALRRTLRRKRRNP